MQKIIPPLKLGMQGKDVANLLEALQFLLDKNILGLSEGEKIELLEHFPGEINEHYYGKITAELVRLFQEKFDLATRVNRGKVDAQTAQKLNSVLEEFGAFEEPTKKEQYHIQGRVFSPTNMAVGSLQVKAWQRGLSASDQPLAQGVTNRFGTYHLTFDKPLSQGRRGDILPDVQVEILSDNTSVAMSKIYYDVSESTTIDMVIDERNSLKLQNEFDSLSDIISEYVDIEEELANLKEDEEYQQITYLANKIGWDARLVAMRVLAEKYHKKSAVLSSLFYALFRAGFPSELEKLYQIGGSTLLKIWKEAIAKNIIDDFNEEVLTLFQDMFAQKSLDYLLETEQPMLDSVLTNNTQKSDFIKLYKKHQDDMKTFWEEIEKKFDKKKTQKLQLHGKLGYLTHNNAALIKKLPNISEPKELINKGFYKAETWKKLLTEETLPNDMNKEICAEHMAAHLRLTYPTTVAAKMVDDGEFALEYESNKEGVETFLTSHQDEFHIGTQPINYFLHKHNLNMEEPIKKEIQRMQRLYQITPSDEAMAVLSKNKISSANEIVEMREDMFIEKCQNRGLDTKTLQTIYAIAEKQSSTSMALLMNEISSRNTPLPDILRDIDMKQSPAIMEKLFGNMDFCSCGHCSSVLSPAAYLVELLQFLNPKEGKKPFDVLSARRPDIEHIELTCENTKTVLPYIDLVNEILEYYVVNKNLVLYKGHNIEEKDTTEDLLANPKYVEETAYDTLKEQVYPMNLPFNKSLEELREYLLQLKVSLYEVMEVFHKKTNLNNEYLGISSGEYKVLTNHYKKEVCKYFGLNNEDMSNAQKLARAIDIKYTDFADILKTEYVNIKLDIDVKDINKCDFSKYKLENATETKYWKLLRFIRLWKKLGWSIEALDKALDILHYDSFTKVLSRLAYIKCVKTLFHINENKALSIWEKGKGGEVNSSPLIRLLELSQKEYDALKDLSGISTPLDDPKETFKFIQMVEMVKSSGFSVQELQYLFKHEDVTGKGSPGKEDILALAKTLRDELVKINLEYTQDQDDPVGEIAKEKMALVFGSEVTDTFFRLLDGNLEDAEKNVFFVKYPELESIYKKFEQSEIKYSSILESILPTLKEKAKILSVKQTLGALLGVDQLVLNRVLNGKLKDSKYYILQSQKLKTDPIVIDFLNIFQDKKIPNDFYFEVPKSENYNFYIESNSEVELKINDNLIPLTNTRQNEESIYLESGKLHHLIIIGDFKDLQWQSFGIARETIPEKYLYASEKIKLFGKSYIRLLKVLLFIEKLNLSEEETIHFVNEKDLQFHENNKLETILNKIPVQKDMKNEKLLFEKFIKLLKYNELKALLKINDDDLVTLLKNPNVEDEEGNSLLLKFTGWSEDDKKALLEYFKLKESDLSNWENFLKVQKAYELVKKVALPAKELILYATYDPTHDVVKNMKDALEKKYDHPKAWLEVQQKVNDKLRNRQRDALISYILYQMKKNPKLQHIDTSNKLFEYFLIDVNRDACWKTSRIKEATLTVQLFIERCLMNFEYYDEIKPVVIDKKDKKQWEWMKRYRVWEANRKVFLYPENWMEPELRTDKTPFFQEFESELLQSDITDDLAQQALIHYLEKLDTVAKLEISAMHQEYDEDGDKTILRLFGRTPGMSRKYYYRKYDYAIGIWTAWEKVDLSIEDNPILPVIWNGRLFLFWINIIKKGVEPKINGSLEDFSKDKTADTSPKEKIEINLSWSEYYNYKWQPTMTSDFDNPLELGDYLVNGLNRFKREDISLGYKLENKLIIIVWYKDNKEKQQNKNFEFFNKHSLPVVDSHTPDKDTEQIRDIQKFKSIYEADSRDVPILIVNYKNQYGSNNHELLNLNGIKNPSIVISNKDLEKTIEAPFVYQDEKYLFLVQPEGNVLPLDEKDISPIEPALELDDLFEDARLTEKEGFMGVMITPKEQLTAGGRLLVILSSGQSFTFENTNIFFQGVKNEYR